MRLVFAGTPAVALPSLRALLDSSHDVIAVLSRPDAPAGRGQSDRQTPVAEVAHESGIELLQPARLSEPTFLERMAVLEPDCSPIVAFGGLIPPNALRLPRFGWINLHFSLLPAWRGAAPVQHAILHGDEITGASTFVLDEGLDTGPLLGSVTEEIRPRDTSGELLDRLAVTGADLLLRTLDGIESGELGAIAQPREGASRAPKLTVDDARVEWASPALHIDRLVRACTPAPGAWTMFRGDRIKVFAVELVADAVDGEPGAIHADKSTVHVGTGSFGIQLVLVQPQGKRPMAAADWARGVRVEPGESFG